MTFFGRLLTPLLRWLGVPLPADPAAAPPGPPEPVAVSDDEIRNVFAGKAACPPKPWPVGFGPYEFRADGEFVREQDLASLFGRYTISGGRIRVTFAAGSAPDFCFAVLKDGGGQYFFREEPASGAVPTSSGAIFPVAPCPLP